VPRLTLSFFRPKSRANADQSPPPQKKKSDVKPVKVSQELPPFRVREAWNQQLDIAEVEVPVVRTTPKQVMALLSPLTEGLCEDTLRMNDWVDTLTQVFDTSDMLATLKASPPEFVTPQQLKRLSAMKTASRTQNRAQYADLAIDLFSALESPQADIAKIHPYFGSIESNDTSEIIDRFVKQMGNLLIALIFTKMNGESEKVDQALNSYPSNFACRDGAFQEMDDAMGHLLGDYRRTQVYAYINGQMTDQSIGKHAISIYQRHIPAAAKLFLGAKRSTITDADQYAVQAMSQVMAREVWQFTTGFRPFLVERLQDDLTEIFTLLSTAVETPDRLDELAYSPLFTMLELEVSDLLTPLDDTYMPRMADVDISELELKTVIQKSFHTVFEQFPDNVDKVNDLFTAIIAQLQSDRIIVENTDLDDSGTYTLKAHATGPLRSPRIQFDGTEVILHQYDALVKGLAKRTLVYQPTDDMADVFQTALAGTVLLPNATPETDFSAPTYRDFFQANGIKTISEVRSVLKDPLASTKGVRHRLDLLMTASSPCVNGSAYIARAICKDVDLNALSDRFSDQTDIVNRIETIIANMDVITEKQVLPADDFLLQLAHPQHEILDIDTNDTASVSGLCGRLVQNNAPQEIFINFLANIAPTSVVDATDEILEMTFINGDSILFRLDPETIGFFLDHLTPQRKAEQLLRTESNGMTLLEVIQQKKPSHCSFFILCLAHSLKDLSDKTIHDLFAICGKLLEGKKKYELGALTRSLFRCPIERRIDLLKCGKPSLLRQTIGASQSNIIDTLLTPQHISELGPKETVDLLIDQHVLFDARKNGMNGVFDRLFSTEVITALGPENIERLLSTPMGKKGHTIVHATAPKDTRPVLNRLLDEPVLRQLGPDIVFNLISLPDEAGLTPVHASALTRNNEGLDQLVQSGTLTLLGVDRMSTLLTTHNKVGLTPLHIAAKKDLITVFEQLFSPETITVFGKDHLLKIMTEANTPFNPAMLVFTGLQYTPLHFASEQPDTDILERLLDPITLHALGAETVLLILQQSTQNGYSPLHLAAENADSFFIDRLLDPEVIEALGARSILELLSQTDATGETPLHAAARSRNTAFLEKLLSPAIVEFFAPSPIATLFCLKNKAKKSPIQLARKFKLRDVIDGLKQHALHEDIPPETTRAIGNQLGRTQGCIIS
jgi:ankyrin repeat protein